MEIAPYKNRVTRMGPPRSYSFVIALLFCVFALPLFAQKQMETSQPVVLSPEQAAKEGKELVAEILSQKPAQNTTNNGVMTIRRNNTRTAIPIQFSVWITPTNWLSGYNARTTNYVFQISVVHTDNQSNIYYSNNYALVGNSGVMSTLPGVMSKWAINNPFANSDFSIADLGLEFLHWPDQKLLQKEMKRSRSCLVLESTNPNPTADGYAKVKSWVDNESKGILLAQAFDTKGKKIKEFIPGDVSRSKVTGQWQLGKMEIDNFQTDSSTIVRFDVDK